ncbi:hypothetical protein [Halomonas sp.]|uniref:hypothetical protein n=1 Tax=Halomonas sp. TaxID=1486246 RepID=UPI003562A4E3
MVNTYGDETEPGIITEETSANNIVSTGNAPSDACIVGPADLASATNAATPDQVYEITQERTAKDRFGETSLLTHAIVDMLREGAAPVYAAAPASTDEVAEDHSADSSTTISLANAPASENGADFTVNFGGSALNVNLTYESVGGKSPSAGECFVNPVDAEVEVPSAPSGVSGMDVDYTWYDYSATLDAIKADIEVAETIDFLTAVQENSAVQQDVLATAEEMSDDQNYTIAFVAPNATVIDASNYTNTYDSSRAQVVYPTRFSDTTSALAAYTGKRAELGLTRTAVGQQLDSDKLLMQSLTRQQRGDLIDENVVPLENRTGGAEIKDDKTAIADDNTDEQHIDYGFKRLVLDYVYETARANEQPFIGRLNQVHIRNTLQHLIAYQLTGLRESNLIEDFSVRVYEESATKARLELNIVAPDPLRFIENNVVVGSA